jgi:hypothetical protein
MNPSPILGLYSNNSIFTTATTEINYVAVDSSSVFLQTHTQRWSVRNYKCQRLNLTV